MLHNQKANTKEISFLITNTDLTCYFLVQLYKFEIIRIAACFLIVESIDAHVGFLHLLGSIVKRGGGVLHGCYCHYHIGSEDSTVRAFKALRLYLKYFTHSLFCYMKPQLVVKILSQLIEFSELCFTFYFFQFFGAFLRDSQ